MKKTLTLFIALILVAGIVSVAKSADIDISYRVEATGYPKDRHIVQSSDGTIVVLYQAGSPGYPEPMLGIRAKKSTDNGTTWTDLAGVVGDSTQVADTSYPEFSICIDTNDNIYVAYEDYDDSSGNWWLYFNKLTYQAATGTWTKGSEKIVADGGDSEDPSIIYQESTGWVWVAYGHENETNGWLEAAYSGDDFQTRTQKMVTSSDPDYDAMDFHPALVIRNGNPFIVYQDSEEGYNLWWSSWDGSWWSSPKQVSTIKCYTDRFSVTMIGNDVHVVTALFSTFPINYTYYNGTTWQPPETLALPQDWSSLSLTTDNVDLWCFSTIYYPDTGYNIKYKRRNGSTWDSDWTAITTDNTWNYRPTTPAIVTGEIPFAWTFGNASPYTVKFGILTGPPAPTNVNDGKSGWSSDNTPTFNWSTPPDPSGIEGYWWAVDDPTPETGGTWTTTAPPATTAPLSNGTHVFYVKAKNNAGLLGPAGSHACFIDTTKPTANAGPDRTVDEDTSVTFNGSGSSDNVGIVSYQWNFGDGATGSGITVSHTYPNPGIYTVTLTVTDGAGLPDSDTLIMMIRDVTPPVADAGSDQTVNEDTPVIFNGGGSSDNAGIVSYQWNFGDGGTGSGITVNHVYVQPGTYTVTLTVNDAAGNGPVSDTMTVTVLDVTPPVGDAGPDQTVDEDTSVTFNGGSSDNVGVVSYQWNFGDGSTASGITTSHTYSTPGTYTVTLTVTDGAGLSDSDTLIMTVRDTTPPVVEAGPDQTVNEDTSVTFNGGGSNDNAGIVSYQWNFGDGGTGNGITVSHTYSTPGTYTVTLTVDDAAGNGPVSDTLTVTVLDVTPPVGDAGPDQTVDEDTSVTFDGGGSSDNVGIVSYQWNFGDGGTGSGIINSHIYSTPGTYTVTLTVTDGAGLSDSDILTLIVRDTTPPVVDAGPDRTVNEDISATFDGSGSSDNVGIVSYTWNFGDGGTASGITVSHTYSNPGTYTLTLSVDDAAGNGPVSDTLKVTVLDTTPPVADAGPDQTVDEDMLVTFDGGGSSDDKGIVSYQWNFGDGGTASGITISHTYSTPGTYTVTLTVTDEVGLSDSDTLIVTVRDVTAPVAEAGSDRIINKDISITFNGSGSSDNAGIVSYQWNFGDGGTGSGITVSHTYSTPGTYTVTLTVDDAAGNGPVSDTLTVVVDTTPPVADAGPDQTVNEDISVTFNGGGSSDNVGIVSYQWNFGDGATGNGITDSHTYSTPGTYTVTLTVDDAVGNGPVSDTLTVTVIDVTPPVAEAGSDQTVNEDTSVTFNGGGSSDNAGIVSYQWNFGDGGTASGITVSHIYSNPGTYTVTLSVNDAAGNGPVSDTLTVTVIDVTPPVADAGPNQTVNEDTLVTFNGSGSGDNVGIVSYQWNFGDGGTASGIAVSHIYPTPGTYTVTLTVTDGAGLSDSDTLTLTVLDVTPPVADAGPDQIVSEDISTTFNGGGSSDNVGIVSYSWNFGDGSTASGITVSHAYSNPGTYTVTFSVDDAAGNGPVSDTLKVTVVDTTPPVADAGPDQTVDEDIPVTFDGNGSSDDEGIVSYQWNFGDGGTGSGITNSHTYSNSGTYTVTLTVTDGAGLSDSDTLTVTVLDATPPVAEAGPDQTVNEDISVTFNGNASSDNVGIVSYQWNFGDGGTGNGITVSHAYSNPGTYTVTLSVNDAAGNGPVSDTLTVTVLDATPPTAEAGPNQTVNEDISVTFDGSGSSDDKGIVNYQWDFGDGGTGNGITVSHTYTESGTYTVTLTVTDGVGLSDSDTLTVTVLDTTPPVGDAGPDQTVNKDISITFDGSGSSDNVGIVSYQWNFGDGGTGNGITVSHTYSTPGTYTVTLTVDDAAGNGPVNDILTVIVDTTPPIAEAGPDQTENAGISVTFDGSGSSDNIGVVSYQWDFGDGSVGSGITVNHIYFEPSTYTVTLTVTDGAGLTGNDTLEVTILDAAPLQIVSVFPRENAPGAAPESNIMITFNKEMDKNSVEQSVGITAVRDKDGRSIDEHLEVTSIWDNNTIIIDAPFKHNYTYRVFVSSNATDAFLNPLSEEKLWYFTTYLNCAESNTVLPFPEDSIKFNDNKTSIYIESNVLPQNGYITVAMAPLNQPEVAGTTNIYEANRKSRKDANQFTYPLDGTIREFNFYDKDGNRVVERFDSCATITIPYKDEDGDGIVDGTEPPVRENTLSVYWLNEEHSLWVRLPGSVVDTEANKVSVGVRGFSVYTLMGANFTDLSRVYCYPVPYVMNDGNDETGTEDGGITFVNLSSGAEIRIYTISGELVKRIEHDDGSPVYNWDVKGDGGQKLFSGVYIYHVKNEREEKFGKLVIIR